MTMDLRQITPDFAVAPQITPEEVAAIAALGYRTLINNRPDDEIEDALDSDAMAVAAAEAGLAYHHLPYFPGQMTPDLVAAFEAVMATVEGPVLAYCRSGTRSTLLWALAEASKGANPTVIAAQAARAGFDIAPVRPLVDMLAAQQ